MNSAAKSLNRMFKNKMICLHFDSNFGREMWCEALLIAAYILKINMTNAMGTKTAEKLYQRKPKLLYIKVFWIHAYPRNFIHLNKLNSNSKKYIFVGYVVTKAFILWDEERMNIIIPRDVYFQKERNNIKKFKTKSIHYPKMTDYNRNMKLCL